jgi:hypothetical protein
MRLECRRHNAQRLPDPVENAPAPFECGDGIWPIPCFHRDFVAAYRGSRPFINEDINNRAEPVSTPRRAAAELEYLRGQGAQSKRV